MAEITPLSVQTVLFKHFKNLTQAVFYITRCTRAVIHAHYHSLNENTFWIGARRPQLFRCLFEEFGTESVEKCETLWKAYIDILGQSQGDMILLERDNCISFKEGRVLGKKPPRFIPAVFPVVRRIMEGEQVAPRSLLHDLYRSDLLDRFRINDSPDFIGFLLRWVARFNAIRHRMVSREELVKLLKVEDEAEELWVLGLIELLGFLSILRSNYWLEPVIRLPENPKKIKIYKIQNNADPAFVLSNLFGRSTGIQGLDYLFYGGVWVPGGVAGQENLSMVISGGPGLGKSTLASTLAAQLAARGGLAIYLHFQLDSQTVLRQLQQFHQDLLPLFDLVTVDSFDDKQSKRDMDKGLMLVSPMPTATHEMIEKALLKYVKQVETSSIGGLRLRERLVVFDSISACEGYGNPVSDWRRFLERLILQLRTHHFNTCFLVEREGGLDGFEEYLADVDIRLSSSRTKGYLFRTLAIVKSRWQACHRGHHVYTIRTPEGMRVFPSSAANITVEWKREPHIRLTAEREPIDPGVIGFKKYLGLSYQGIDLKKAREPWWMKGSITALIGPRGTLKTAFGSIFCEVVKNDEPDFLPSSLFLHLAAETRGGRQGESFTRAFSRPVSIGTRYDVPLQSSPKESSASVTHLFYRSGYLVSGQVMQVLRDLIAEKREKGTPIRRAVIADAGNILPDFAALSEDLTFIPALCSLLSSEGVTTLLIYSRPEHGGPDYIVDQVRSTSQNIIECERIYYAGRLRIALSVSRSFDEMHDRGIYELVKTADKKNPLRLENTFDLVLDALSGNPKVAKIKLILHAETTLQRKYHESMRTLHHSLGAYSVEILGHALGLAHYQIAREVIAGERALWITQVDAEAYSAWLMNHNDTENVFCELNCWALQVEETSNELAGHIPVLNKSTSTPNEASPRPHKGVRKKGVSIRSMPFYLNPSFLMVRKDFADFARDKLHINFGSDCTGMEYSWFELLDAATNFLDSGLLADSEKGPICDCPMETAENINCIFLEILASVFGGANKVNNLDFFTCFGSESPHLKGDGNLFVQVAKILHRALHESLSWHLKRGKKYDEKIMQLKEQDELENVNQSFFSNPFTNSKALIQRHWYSTSRQMLSDSEQGCPWTNTRFETIHLPGGVWTCGDWHLGILEGSVGVRTGINILLEEFLSPRAASARLVQGVGLPPHRVFYDNPIQANEGRMPVLQVNLSWFKSYVERVNVIHRSAINGYQEIAPILNGYLYSIISNPVKDDSWIKDQFLSMHCVIRSLKENGF